MKRSLHPEGELLGDLDDLAVRPEQGKHFYIDITTVLTACSIAAVFLIWFVISLAGIVSNRYLVSPHHVMREIWLLINDGYIGIPLHVHIGRSLARSLVGLFVAIIAGVPLGLVVGYNRITTAALSPPLAMFRPIPAIALIPLVVLWFGIGEFAKILLIFWAAFLYITLSVAGAVKEVRDVLLRAGAMLGATQRQMFLYIIFPEALPSIMNSIRVGTAIAWTVVVASELIAAQKGLGYMVMDAATFFRTADVYVGIIIIGVIGFCLEQAIRYIDNRFVHWSGK